MSSVMGETSHLTTLRRARRPGEIGHPGTCPLCADATGSRAAPPCLACRDELRARLSEFHASAYAARAVN